MEMRAESEQRKILKESVGTLAHFRPEVPQISGIPSGVEGLDDLFFTTGHDERGQLVIKPLGGYPSGSVLQITGVPDSGKSLMVEQFAIKQASMGYSCCFVTVEQPAPFLIAGLRQRALALGVNEQLIEDRIVIIDAASHAPLREDLMALGDTLAYAIKQYRCRSVVIDSVTGLYEAREMQARQIVRFLYHFLKKWRQTALLISQKRSSHEDISAEAAGGYAVGHIVDGTLVLSKREIMSAYDERWYHLPFGSVIRLFRIDGCRVAGHDTRVHTLDISEAGLIKVGPPVTHTKGGQEEA
ncbi:KaiC domain-containing protein [Thermogemmatispora aurantia]|jgi:KaiC domain protein|uniref:KaiC domain-containing protein n=1 Tax=Thermogemmatispora aurantia TaxID=2045279 RepID=A0A5J4K9Q9_9CHLR|nr:MULTISPECIES: KaiC domain-containing protein [Thermogemmatispora]GER85324.1 KaiC domain-containing protein [Thermogemmatispora aurantia]